jgi:ribosome-binding protein aMBF1 (putative translation factor)
MLECMYTEPRQSQAVLPHHAVANPRRSRARSAGAGDRHNGALDALIAERVRALRTSRGWRSLDLAVAAGWSHASVLAVEAGDKRVTIRDAAALCRVLQVPLVSLLEGAEEATALGLTAPSGGAQV